MKPIAIALVLVTASVAGAAGAGTVLLMQAPAAAANDEPVEARPAAPGEAVAAGGSEAVERLEAEVRMLGTRLADLSREFQQVRTAAERTPVPEVAGAASVVPPTALAVQKEQVASILTEIREEEERARELERQEREKRQMENRAERIARELGMGPGDQTRLVEFMTQASVKREELMVQMRDGGLDREAMRTSFESLRVWSTAELNKSFGPQLAEQIMQQSPELGFGGPGGFAGQQQRGRRGAQQGGAGGGQAGGQGGF